MIVIAPNQLLRFARKAQCIKKTIGQFTQAVLLRDQDANMFIFHLAEMNDIIP